MLWGNYQYTEDLVCLYHLPYKNIMTKLMKNLDLRHGLIKVPKKIQWNTIGHQYKQWVKSSKQKQQKQKIDGLMSN